MGDAAENRLHGNSAKLRSQLWKYPRSPQRRLERTDHNYYTGTKRHIADGMMNAKQLTIFLNTSKRFTDLFIFSYDS